LRVKGTKGDERVKGRKGDERVKGETITKMSGKMNKK
jgi:hypothetical protein